MVSDNLPNNDPKGLKRFIGKHWILMALFVLAAASAVFGAVSVFLWYVANAQSSSLVPKVIGQWTMAHTLSFMLNLVLWELVLVGVPVTIASVAGWLWWRRLPYEERKEYHFFNSTSRSRSDGGGTVSMLFWIAFSIRVYLDGNWNIAIGSWTLDYFVNTSVWTLIWMLILVGIPASVIGIIWWINQQSKPKP